MISRSFRLARNQRVQLAKRLGDGGAQAHVTAFQLRVSGSVTPSRCLDSRQGGIDPGKRSFGLIPVHEVLASAKVRLGKALPENSSTVC
jgi:hypothetical protein